MISLYLDTSVINFLFADDTPEKKEITVDLFDNYIAKGIYDTFISQFVLQEIEQTTDEEKKQNLFTIIATYPLQPLIITDLPAVDTLADLYISEGIIPLRKRLDALHVACAVLHRIDYLVSWNYRHLANVNKEKRILSLNFAHHYLHPLRIITPLELLGYEDNT
ncbi:MAG: hypothetical protein ICV79_28725 [Flavisolibacter sp.]|nr:hypothetical protein [Flavisolibacter sp.]